MNLITVIYYMNAANSCKYLENTGHNIIIILLLAVTAAEDLYLYKMMFMLQQHKH